jgi:hypothetical protein
MVAGSTKATRSTHRQGIKVPNLLEKEIGSIGARIVHQGRRKHIAIGKNKERNMRER